MRIDRGNINKVSWVRHNGMFVFHLGIFTYPLATYISQLWSDVLIYIHGDTNKYVDTCAHATGLFVFLSPPGIILLQCYESSYQITIYMREHNDLYLEISVRTVSCLWCPSPLWSHKGWEHTKQNVGVQAIRQARPCPPLNQQRGHVCIKESLWVGVCVFVCGWGSHCNHMKTEMPGHPGNKRKLWGGNDQSDIHHTSSTFDFMQSFHVQANIIWVMEIQMSSISAWE